MAKKRERNRRERELSLLLSAEKSLEGLRRSHQRPTQTWEFVVEALSRLKAERNILARAMAGDEDAIRARQMGGAESYASDTLGK